MILQGLAWQKENFFAPVAQQEYGMYSMLLWHALSVFAAALQSVRGHLQASGGAFNFTTFDLICNSDPYCGEIQDA